MEKTIEICPNCSARIALKQIEKGVSFRGEDLTFQAEVYVCEKCNMEIATIEQTAAMQNAISDEYRKKIGLLSGTEIREKRQELGLSQKELAKRAGVGIASIKRWENGIVQTKAMNSALKAAFEGTVIGNKYTGNNKLSIERIKLVMKEFAKELGFKFLEDGDRMLFDAKYCWYADFLAYHRLGKSLTGATYAALPHGPQINNYKELASSIRDADEKGAKALTDEEKKIIVRVALTFPTKQSVIDAAHREPVYRNKRTGEIIPYSDAEKLTEILL